MADIPVYATLEEKRPFFENDDFFIIIIHYLILNQSFTDLSKHYPINLKNEKTTKTSYKENRTKQTKFK